jgi:two-component system, sensor histidine kinase LadS
MRCRVRIGPPSGGGSLDAALGWLAFAFTLASAAPVEVSRIEVLADPAGRLGIDAVAAAEQGWGSPPRLRRPEVVSYWARLRVESRLGRDAAYTVVPERLWQQVDVYAAAPDGGWVRVRSGELIPLGERPYAQPAVALPVELRPGAQVLYLHFRSNLGDYGAPRKVDARLQPEASFLNDQLRSHQFHAAYAGLILAMVLYNFFLYVALRDRAYLLYVLYAASFGSIWVARSGLTLEWLWPAWPRGNHLSTFYLIAASLAFGCLFVRAFLDTRRHAPLIHRGLSALMGAVAVSVVLGMLGSWRAAETMLAYSSLLACPAFVAAGLAAWRKGFGPARIYLLAWSALLAGVLAYTLTYLGVLRESFLSLYGVQIGSAAEVLLLAFALADRINVLRRGQDVAQSRYQSVLEREVRERTHDLETVNLRLRDANERLARLSRRDELTGLANRRHLETVLDAEWRRCARTAQPLSLILLDVDHFKDYNDEYGHLAGDRCLQRVAQALAERCLRAGDLAARFGGEEFLIVLPGTDRDGAALMAERLRDAVQALAIPHAPSAPFPVVTISAGVGSMFPREGLTSDDVLAGADAALYTAKRQGRNRVACQPAPPPSSS